LPFPDARVSFIIAGVMHDTMKTILVTGATDGIGLETARQLVAMGHRVVLHGRRQERLDAARAELAPEATAPIETAVADFARLASVHAMAEELRARGLVLDVLVNNAGIYANDPELTDDGFEATFGVNHVAPFLLTHLLLPALATRGARIVTVSSIAHGRGRLDPRTWRSLAGFDPYGAYAQSKLANVLMTAELARRLPAHVIAFSLHPGVVSTKLLTEGFGMRGSDSLAAGADTSVWLATAPEARALSGRYVVKRREGRAHHLAQDARATADFYLKSAELAGVEPLPAPEA
jgi:NAD(P)-dependent dehydrogenase (short-subunit alcohol dehydrogenase family)